MTSSTITDEPVLIVDSGVHKGARIRLPRGESRVGGDPDCAVVVVDPALEGGGLCVTVDDAVTIQSDCGLLISDGRAVMPGETFDVARNCSFTVGDTIFTLELPGDDSNERNRNAIPDHWRSLWLIPVGIATLGGAALIGAVLVGGRAAPAPALGSPTPPVLAAVAAEIAATFLRQRLENAGLSGLAATPQPDGAVVVSGALASARRHDWAAIRQEYDQRFGTQRVLVERFDAPGAMPSLHVAAVWVGPSPYVLDDHGSRLGPGASLGGGWSIAKIDRENVIVQQGTRTLALRY